MGHPTVHRMRRLPERDEDGGGDGCSHGWMHRSTEVPYRVLPPIIPRSTSPSEAPVRPGRIAARTRHQHGINTGSASAPPACQSLASLVDTRVGARRGAARRECTADATRSRSPTTVASSAVSRRGRRELGSIPVGTIQGALQAIHACGADDCAVSVHEPCVVDGDHRH